MNHLLHLNTAADRTAVLQTNMERLDVSMAFVLNPSKVAGVATVDPGAPTAGEGYVGELWVDVNNAVWRCKTAGTPGTWLQITPAVVEADPVGIPDGYVIARVAEYLKLYRWNNGGAAWAAV